MISRFHHYMKPFHFGSAFSDNVLAHTKPTRSLLPKGGKKWWQGTGRVLILSSLLWVVVSILIFRLFYLTIMNGFRFRVLADQNRTKELTIHAPRGVLYDRRHTPLVKNIPRFRLLSPCRDKKDELCVSKLSLEEGETLKTQGLPPMHFLEVDYEREYVYPEATAHVVGYTGEIGDAELNDEYYTLRKYERGDHLGRSGSEALFEEKLRGRDGKELIEVDAQGKILRVLGRDNEIPGEDVSITIDASLSQAIYNAFPKGQKGAVIISQPRTGEIAALFSSPTYSTNTFSLGMSGKEYETLLGNPDRPLFNRAIGGVYPPGSTFKIVTSVAGLEENVLTKDTLFEDTGVLTIGPYQFHNWYFLRYGKSDGMVNMVKALAHSNDIYFYKAGEQIGVTKLQEWAKKLGAGRHLGIELAGEAEGLVPSQEWKRKYFTSKEEVSTRQNEWYLGDTYHMAIGQGYLLTTPLQVNTWTNVIASRGILCTPTIQKHASQKDQEKDCTKLPIKDSTIATIIQGMYQACTEGGTAYPLFGFSVKKIKDDGKEEIRTIPVACKTGTAEFGSPENKTHAWITLFAPVPAEYLPDSVAKDPRVITGLPELTLTVLVEGGGEGSDVAAPVAKKILEEWFKR